MRNLAIVAALACVLSVSATAAAQQPPPPPAGGTDASVTPSPLLGEPALLARAIRRVERFGNDEQGQPSDGFYAEFGKMITGAGWVSVGPGFRHRLWGDRAMVDISAAASWRAYKMAQGRFELPHLANDRLTIGAQAFWQDYTQVRYFGAGAESLETTPTDYRMQASDVVGYAAWRPRTPLAVTGTVGVLSRPRLSSSTGPFDRDEPDTLTVFATEPGAGGDRQPRYVHADAAIAFDSRDHPSYPHRGGLYRAAWATYRDRGDGTQSFNRLDVEAAQFVPVVHDRGVLAVHWWTVLSGTADDAAVPFYFLPSLGGGNTLRGFSDYRFHDRHLLLVNVESRWALMPHVDAAAFFDAGNVAARAKDLGVERTSAGFGFRVHTTSTTLVRFDVAKSEEGWRFLLKLSDPIRISRLSRRMAALPFVP